MQQLTLKDPFKQVLVLWREHRRKISQEIKKSRRDETRLRSIGQKIRLIVWGSVLLALGITILALLGHFQRIFGVSAARVASFVSLAIFDLRSTELASAGSSVQTKR
jgi:hypothetical protein